jgi:alkanesulfonate monooxygenase SsuD/methylene tetrahydromethanopterin reductase-like flavin-dependent oxidoreductase (luciferase family)
MANSAATPDTPDTLRFGIFDWIDENKGLALGEVYEQRLRMLELADEAGIWGYHLAEHHGTPLAVSPSPNLFLTAAAQRTTRLRLGPMVQLLPLYNPLRNIEEACFLDNISGGRLELGVGRGVSPEELEIYGLTSDEARGRFGECFDILMQGLTQPEVNYEGTYYSIKHAPMTIRPLQQPHPPLWYPTSNPERVTWVAERGFHTLFGFSHTGPEIIAAGVDQYRATLAALSDGGRQPAGHEAMLGATRHVYVDETDAKAMEVARRAYGDFDLNFRTRPGRSPDAPSRRGDFDTALGWGGIIVGSPDTVRAKVQEFLAGTGINYFVGTFAFGSLGTEHVLRSLGLFSREVMPALQPSASVR